MSSWVNKALLKWEVSGVKVAGDARGGRWRKAEKKPAACDVAGEREVSVGFAIQRLGKDAACEAA